MAQSIAAQKLAQELSSLLRSWALDHPNGLTESRLTEVYKQMMCTHQVPFRRYGFGSFSSFLQAFPAYFEVSETGIIKHKIRSLTAGLENIRVHRPERRIVFQLL